MFFFLFLHLGLVFLSFKLKPNFPCLTLLTAPNPSPPYPIYFLNIFFLISTISFSRMITFEVSAWLTFYYCFIFSTMIILLFLVVSYTYTCRHSYFGICTNQQHMFGSTLGVFLYSLFCNSK